METRAEPAAARGYAVAGLLLALATGALLRVPVAAIPFERDEGGYAYIAERWLEGEVPYRDSFDQKPPAVFGVYALALVGFGRTPQALHAFAQLYTTATLLLLFALGRRLVPLPAAVAGTLLAALLTVDASFLGSAANSELFALLPLVAAGLAARRAAERGGIGWSLAAGAAGAAAFLFKPVVAPILAFHALAVAFARRRWLREPALQLAGFAAVLAPLLAGFAAVGALDDLLDATLLHNLAYASGLPLASYAAYLRAELGDFLPTLAPIGAAALLAPLAGRDAGRRGGLWLAGWLATALVAVAAGGYFRRHYFLLAVPSLALLAGLGLHGLARRIAPPRAAPWLALAGAAALVAHAVLQAPWYYAPGDPDAKARRLYGSNPFPESPVLARFLAEHSTPQDRIFVYGSEPQVLFLAERRSASRYIYVYPLTMPLPGVAERQRELLDGLRAAPPRFVVGVFLSTSLLEQPGTPPDLRRGLQELVEARYRIAAAMPFTRDGYGVLVTGDPARALWERAPLWDGRTPWASFVVWERVD